MTASPSVRAARPRSGPLPVFVAVVAVFTGQQLLTPLLPSLAVRLGLDAVAIGVVLSTAAALGLVLSPVWGRYCQRWGLRRVLVAAVLGSGAVLLAFALAGLAGLAGVVGAGACLALLVATRGVLFGVTCSAVPVVAQAYVAAVTRDGPARVRGIAALGACTGVGVVVGPPLGGLLAGVDLGWALVAPAVLVLAVGAWLAVAVPPVDPGDAAREASRLSPLDPRVRPYLVLAFGTFLTLTASQVTLGFLVQDRLGLAPGPAAQVTGLLLTALGGGFVLTQLLLVPRLGWPPRRLVRCGTLAGIPACAALAVAADVATLAAALVVAGIGVGLAAAGFMSAPTLLVPARDQGAVAGFLAAADGLAFVVGPVAATALYSLSPAAPYAACAVVLALLLIVALTAPTTEGTPR